MTETKRTFVDKVADVLTPVAAKMQDFHLLASLSNTMQVNMPVTIIGSFACLAAFLDLGNWQAFMGANPQIQMIFMSIQSLTLSLFSLYILVTLPYIYANRLGMKQAVGMIPMTLAAYLLITPHALYTNIPSEWLGHKGLISVVLITLIVVRFTKLCIDKGFYVKMPAGVPKFVEDGFAILVPATIVFVGFAIIQSVFSLTEYGTIHNIVYTILQVPFQSIGLSMIGNAVTEVAATLFMFLGVHANTIIGIVEPVRLAAAVENLAALQAGLPLPNIVVTGFSGLALIGAGGSLLSATLAFLFFTKSKRYQSISKMALIPGIFGVGEPILFGLPIMLNPVAFIPFIGVVLFNQIYAYLVIALGFVGKFTGVAISWTVPPFLNMFLSNSTPILASIALLIELLINLAIWYPFVKILDREALKEEAKAITTN